jgi:hypothetical protein
MPMVTYPLNNIEYTAEDAELFHSTRTSGVYATNSFDYSVTGSDNTIVIGNGIAWIKNSEFAGKVVARKEPISLDMGLSDSIYQRIDAIVIQFDANKNATEIVVKNGVPSSKPTAPSVVRTESIYELHLYHVRRSAGSLTISANNITDLRSNNNYCGLMTDSVTQAVDTTLSRHGVAADSAAVGNRISNLKASDVGARPSDWMPTLAEIGAQKIIGFGQITGDLNDYEKLRNTVVWVNGNSVTNSPTTNFAVVETWSNGGGIILQRITTVSHNVALRMRYNSEWTEWGWINPPMNIGTEYRLIEKWNGKTVYCKVISCGALVAAGSRKTVSIGQAGITRIVRHCGYAVYGSSAGEDYKGTPVSLPIYGVTGLIGYHAVAAEGLIYIECIEDGTEFTSSYITLWYTKD